jgi:Bacterial capsule synthesis protein PGA_cap
MRGYSGLLERPGTPRSLARRRRQRPRTLVAVVVLLAVAGGVAFAVVRTGALGQGRPLGRATPPSPGSVHPTRTADATTSPKVVPAATPTRSPIPTAPARASAPASAVVELGWVGDTTPGSKYGLPPNAGRALFQYTRTYTKAPDIMVANLEGTFGSGGASKCDGSKSGLCFAFQAPPKNASALKWAGFDVVNLANNHSNDYFGAGLQSTKKALSANGIEYTGLDGVIATKEVNGVKVAFLGFSPYPWSPNIGNLRGAQALVRKADATADVVVVLMHAGAEGADKSHTPKGAENAFGEFRGDSRAFSRAVIDAGADVVLGSGPHVIRGMEQYRGRLIAYSLGNFAGWKNFGRSGDLALSGLLTVNVAGDGRVLGGRWLSLRIADPGVPKLDPSRASVSLVRRRSAEDFASPVRLRADGTFRMAGK